MQQMINIREVNQNLSKYINSLKSGDDIVITKHGKPIAKLVSYSQSNTLDDKQQEALARLHGKLDKGFHLGGKGFDRDSLYER